MFSNVIEHLSSIDGDRCAVIEGDNKLSYSKLLQRAKATSDRLGTERSLVLLECHSNTDWLTAYLACLIGNHVVILIPSNNPTMLSRLTKEFEPQFIVRCEDGVDIEKITNEVNEMHDDLCILLSTSGSTGSPKCVRLSKENLSSNATAIGQYLCITKDDKGVVNLPTNYSFGLSIVNSHLAKGATIVFNKYSMIEPEFWGICEKERVTSFAGVPHSYDLLSKMDYQKLIPSSVKYFTQAGGKLSKDKVIEFATFAEQAGSKFFVMYGQTEASPRISYLPPHLAKEYPESIGQAIPGGELEIQDDHGNSVANGTTGELVYRGPNVMMGYALKAEDLKKGKDVSSLKTGDLALKLPNGLISITGRKSRFIKVFGNRISLDQVETLCNDHGITSIATGIDEKLLVLTTDDSSTEKLKSMLMSELKIPNQSIEIRYVSQFPTLNTGKIDYNSLKSDLIAREEFSGEKSVQEVFIGVFGSPALDTSKSFTDLGGDSLTYVKVSIGLEDCISKLPDDWISLSIDSLNKLDKADKTNTEMRFNRLANVDTLRAFACILVVSFHVFGSTPDFGLHFSENSPYRAFFSVLDLLRMPLFTALAGMLFIAMAPSKSDFPAIIINRVQTLIVPAILVTVIYFYIRTFIGKETGSLIDVIIHGYMHLWYLYALFLMIVFIGVIHIFVKPGLKLYFAFLLTFHLVGEYSKGVDFFRVAEAASLTPYFILGILLYKYHAVLLSRRVLIPAATFSIIGALIKLGVFFDVVEFSSLLNFSWLLVSLSMIIMSYRLMPVLPSIQWIGLYTYAIYLWHPMANASTRMALIKIGIDERLILFCIGLLVGVFGPIVLYKLSQKLPKTIRQSLLGR